MRASSPILQAAAQPMRLLAQRERINVGLAVADRDEMVYPESVRYNRRPSLRTVAARQRVPIVLTSLGRAWLAALAPVERRRRDRRQSRLAHEMDAAVTDVDRHGWCAASWQPEVVAVAAPLVVPGHPVHVLNVSMTSARPLAEAAALLAPLLVTLVARIRREIARPRD